MSRILVVDDDPHILRTLEIMLVDDGHQVWTCGSGEAALALVQAQEVDVALVDLQLPAMTGIEVLRSLRERHPALETVIITAHGSIDSAVEAMKEGAFDYVTKPFSPEQIRHRLRQIARVQQLQHEVAGLKRRIGELPYNDDFISQNEDVHRMLDVARNVSSSDASVLIRGESGTGKTLLARLIHGSSARRNGPFVVLDCASLQESLLESELFGHKRGAFTGAIGDKVGKVETAQGGTLFLDEIGEVPLHLQGKLLRLVEARTYERLGDPSPRFVDARIIAATHRELEEMVHDGGFRADLYYRLSVVELAIPALRHRPDDILLLARSFLASFCQATGSRPADWEPAVERHLVRHSWPGNVRELAHTMERAALLCAGRTLRVEHLPARLVAPAANDEGEGAWPSLAELEERQIRKALAQGWPLEETAHRLGIDPSTLWRKRKKYGI